MPNTETTVLASVQPGATQSWMALASQAVAGGVVRTGSWAGETAQKFAALLADLMGPAVFLVYALTAWSLATGLGWTDSFLFASGPMSNWMVWLALAILLNFAASLLKRRTRSLG